MQKNAMIKCPQTLPKNTVNRLPAQPTTAINMDNIIACIKLILLPRIIYRLPSASAALLRHTASDLADAVTGQNGVIELTPSTASVAGSLAGPTA